MKSEVIKIALFLIVVLVVSGCTSQSQSSSGLSNIQAGEYPEPSWDNFNYCKCFQSLNCYQWRTLCKDDLEFHKYTESEACWMYEITYVQQLKKGTCLADDKQEERYKKTEKYWNLNIPQQETTTIAETTTTLETTATITETTTTTSVTTASETTTTITETGSSTFWVPYGNYTNINGLTYEISDNSVHIYQNQSNGLTAEFIAIMKGHKFTQGEKIEYDFIINKLDGNAATYSSFNKRAFVGVGFWNSVVDISNQLGLYHVKVDIIDPSSITATIQLPDNSYIERNLTNLENLEFQISLSIGDNGAFDFEYKNFEIG